MSNKNDFGSSAELRDNMKTYKEISKNEMNNKEQHETFVFVVQNNAADEDLSRAITVDDVLAQVREGLNEIFAQRGPDESEGLAPKINDATYHK